MANGGARPGAGRPKGSKNLRRFQDYLSEAEIVELVKMGKNKLATSDKVYVEFLQQIFGKPTQPIEGRVDLNIIDEEARAKANKAVGEILSSGHIE